MKTQTPSFLSQRLTDAETSWLKEACENFAFDARKAKLKLLEQLPSGFDPNRIDQRLYRDSAPTLLAKRLLTPGAEIFSTIESVAQLLRHKIIEGTAPDMVPADDLAAELSLLPDLVGEAITHLARVARVSPGGSVRNGFYTHLNLSGDYGYDEFLWWQGIDHILQRWYEQASGPATASNWTVMVPTVAEMPFLGSPAAHGSASVKEGTAFVIMAMDPSRHELVDVHNAIKETCARFGIIARRADDIEHSDRITDLILDEIRTSELLIADLTFERPNVYYEVGYAHALRKKPILYRRDGTSLHFDLAVHNVPTYKNVTELRQMLAKRLQDILGHGPKAA